MPVSTRDGAVLDVDLDDAVHAREADDDGVLGRQGAARQRGAGAARHHLIPFWLQYLRTLRHLLGRARQHDGKRNAPVGGERVGLERAPALLLGDHGVGAEQLLELLDDRTAAGEHGRIRFRQPRQRHANPSAQRPLGHARRGRDGLWEATCRHREGLYNSTTIRMGAELIVVAFRKYPISHATSSNRDRPLSYFFQRGSSDCHKRS